jgi:hypothetical protein
MKIQIEHMVRAIHKWETMSKAELIEHTENLLDVQPKAGGQLAALIIREGIPAKIVEDGISMTCIMFEAVGMAGCSLPMLDHEMFEKEQRNIGAYHHLTAVGEKGLLESMLKGCTEKVLLAYVTNKIIEYNFIERHPQGWLLAMVLESIFSLIDKNLTKTQVKSKKKPSKRKGKK